jgi:Ni/Co efflux regulator RcnB
MRKYLLSATALILLSAPVFADPPDRGGRGEGHGHADRGPTPQAATPAPPQRGPTDRGGDHGPRPQAAVQAPPQRGFERGDHGPGRQAAFQQPQNRDQMRDQMRGDQNRGDRGRPQATLQASAPQFQREDRDRGDRRAFNDNRNDNRDRNAVRPGFNRDFNRDGRTDYRAQRSGPRHDFSGFRDFHRNFQASRRFRGPDYRRPAGWYSHRWAFGEFLPAAFFVRDYWLVDFVDYDLPPPPYGTVWVRVDRDALLIDEDSGEIITVEYDVFY